jgi:PKD-like domain
MISVPTGYTLVAMKATLMHSGGATRVLANILPGATSTSITGGVKYTFDLENLFVATYPPPAGKFAFPDESYDLNLEPEYEITTSTCNSVPKPVVLSGNFKNTCVTATQAAASGTIADNLSPLTFQAPTFANPTGNTVRFKEKVEECFDLSPVSNNPPGTNYFIHLGATTMATVTKVLVNGLPIAPVSTDPTLYFLGTNAVFTICATYTGCTDTSRIHIDMGFQCSSTPPTTFASLVCPTKGIDLKLAPIIIPASFQVSPTPLSYLPNLCEPIDFEVIVKNSGVAYLTQPNMKIFLPNFLKYLPGSATITWGNNINVPVPNPVRTPNTGTISVYDSIATFNFAAFPMPLDSLFTVGLPGSISGQPIQSREYTLKYKVVTLCGFKANTGATYLTSFRDPCNKLLQMVNKAAKIPINFPNSYTTAPDINGDISKIDACGIGTPITLAVRNNGGGATNNADTLSLLLPPSLCIVPGSMANSMNLASLVPIKSFVDGDTLYRWKINSGVAAGMTMGLDIKIRAKPGFACGFMDTFTVATTTRINATCAGQSCATTVETGSSDFKYTIQKSTAKFVAGSLTNFQFMGNMNIISIGIKNTGTTSITPNSGILVNIYNDLNNDGKVQAAEPLLNSSPFPTGLAVGAMTTFYKKITNASPICNLVLTLGGPCVCANDTIADVNCTTPPPCGPAAAFVLPPSNCPGGIAYFYPNNVDTSAYFYQWTFPSAIQINGNPAPPNTVTGAGSHATMWNMPGTYQIKLVKWLKVQNTFCRDSSIQNFIVKPIPLLAPLSSFNIQCENAMVVPTTFVSTPPGATFAWTNTNPAIGLAASGMGQIAAFTPPNNPGPADRVATITVTPTLNGCIGTPVVFTITQKQTPILNTPTPTLICPATAVASQIFVSNPVGANFSWTNSNTAVGLSASMGSGNLPAFTSGANATTANLVSNITVTATFPANGCTSIRATTITVKPTPTVNNPNDITLCPTFMGAPGTFTMSPAGGTQVFSWTNSNIGDGLATATGMGQIGTITAPANAGPANIVGTVVVTPTRDGCVGPTQDFVITIKPQPDLNTIPNITVCPGDLVNPADAVSANLSGTTFAWTNTLVGIGAAASGAGQVPDFTATNSTAANIVGTFKVTATNANGCTRAVNFTVTVRPKPTVNSIASLTYCPGDAVNTTFASTPTGSSFMWTNSNSAVGLAAAMGNTNNISFTATNTGTTNLVTNIAVTPTLNGCIGTPTNFTITVKPKPSVSTPANITVCSGELVNPDDWISTPTGATYAWINTNIATGLGASGNTQITNFSAAPNNTGANIVGTVTVTPTLNGCSGATTSFTITVKPTPQITQIGNQTVCPGAMVTVPGFISTPTSTLFNWTNNTTTIGLGAMGSGNVPNFTAPATNFTGNNIVGTIAATATVNGCVSPAMQFTVAVKPTPTVNDPADLSVCGGDQVDVTDFVSSPSGGSFMWTNSNIAIGILATSGNGQIPTYTAPTNFTTSDIVSNLTVTPTLTSCPGPGQSFTITIKPRPTLNTPASLTVCPGDLVNPDDFMNTNLAGTTFSWSNTNANIGLAASGMAQIANFTATNTTTSNIFGTITVVATSPNGCTNSTNFTITVRPKPTVTSISTLMLCPGDPVLTGWGSSPSGASLAWMHTNAAIGLTMLSGNGNLNFTATNATNAPISSNFSVTPTLNTCIGDATNITITVKPKPILNDPADITVCPGELIDPQDFTSNPAATATFQWTNSNINIGLTTPGANQITPFNAAANNSGVNVTGIITATATVNGCVSVAQNFGVTVKPTPVVTALPDLSVCPGDNVAPANFTTTPSGGTFTWMNSNPAIGLAAMSGMNNIPAFTAAANATSGNISTNISVVGTLNGCASPTDIFTISIKPTPFGNMLADITVCAGQPIDPTNFVSNPAGALFSWVNSNTNIGILGAGMGDIATFNAPVNNSGAPIVGTITVSSSLTGCGGSSQQFTVTINPTPVFNDPADLTVCPGDVVNLADVTSNAPNTNFSWINSNINIGLAASGMGQTPNFTATNATLANISGNITTTGNALGCLFTQMTTVTVRPKPTVTGVASQTVCPGSPVNLNFTSSPTGASFAWTNSNLTLGLTAATGTTNISFTAANATNMTQSTVISTTPTLNTCVGDAFPVTISVKPNPVMNDPADIIVCAGEAIDPNNFVSDPVGASYIWGNSNIAIGLGMSGNGDIATFNAPANATGANIVSTVTVTPTINGCTGASQMFTITIRPTPVVATIPNQIVCPAVMVTTAAFSAAPNSGVSVFNWTNSNMAVGLTSASGTGNLPTFTSAANATNTNVLTIISVKNTLDGCESAPMSFQITVKPTPTMNNPTDFEVCPNATITPSMFVSTPSGAMFMWVNSTTAIGLALNGNTQIAPFTAPPNVTNVNVSANIVITPTLAGCVGPTQDFNVIIKPTPTITAIPNLDVCAGDNVNPTDFVSTPIGASFIWSNSTIATGLAALSGNGQIADFTAAQNAGPANIVSNISATADLAGCSSASINYSIRVHPTLTVNDPADIVICPGQTVNVDDFLASVPVGATYIWTNSNPAVGLLGTSGMGQIPNFNSTNSGNSVISSDLTITPVGSTGCEGVPQNFKITVKPTPIAAPIADMTIVCENSVVNPTDFVSNPTGAIFDWTNSNPAIGLTPISGSGQISNFNAPTNNTAANIISNLSVTPMLNGCVGATEFFIINIAPTPVLNNLPDISACAETTVTPPTFTTTLPNSGFAWTNSSASTGISTSGSGQIIPYIAPANMTGSSFNSQVTVVASFTGGCTSERSFAVEIFPKPVTNAPTNITVCPGEVIDIQDFTSNVAGSTFAWTNSNTTTIGLNSASGSGQIPSWNAPNNNTFSDITSNLTMTATTPDGCQSLVKNFIIAIRPTPVIDPPVTDISVCPNMPVTQNFTTNPAGSSFIWNNSATNTGLTAMGSGNISFTSATNTTGSSLESTVTVVATLNGCVGATETFMIEVKPTPMITALPDVEACPNQLVDFQDFASIPTGASFVWINNNTSTGLSAGGNTQIPNFTTANFTGVDRVSMITATPTLNGCVGPNEVFNLTVHGTPTTPTATNISACPGETIDVPFAGGAGLTYNWTNSNTLIGLADVGMGAISFPAAANATNSDIVGMISVTATGAGGCLSAPQIFEIHVKPTPTVDAETDILVCPGAIIAQNFSGNPAGTMFNWMNNNTNTGLASMGSGDINYIAPENLTASNVTGIVTVTPVREGCVGSAKTFNIGVKPTVLLDDFTDLVLCPTEMGAINFTTNLAGTTTNWMNTNPATGLSGMGAGNISFTAAANNGGTIIVGMVSATATKNGCFSPMKTANISIKPTPMVTAMTAISVCPDENITVPAFASSPSGSNFSWINNNPNIGLVASGSGNISDFSASSNATGLIETATISVVGTLDGCASPAANLLISVRPTPVLNDPIDIVVCPGATVNPTDFTLNPTGGTTSFSWTNSTPTIGLAANGMDQIVDFIALNNTSTTNLVGNITATGTRDGCESLPQTFTVSIKPTPTISAPADITVCPTENILVASWTSNLIGATVNWTNNNLNTGISGNGIGDLPITQAAANATNANIVSTLVAVATVSSCPSLPDTVKVTVRPTPTMNIPADLTVCPGSTVDVSTFVSTPTGASFLWNNSLPAIGLAGSGMDQIADFMATNPNSSGGNWLSSVSVTPVLNGCAGPTVDFSILEKETPVVDNLADFAVCPGETIAQMFGANVAGTYSWTNNNLLTGISASGSGNLGAFTALPNATQNNIVSTISVKITDADNCESALKTFQISVKPTPMVTMLPDTSVCAGELISANFTSLPSNSTFDWTNTNTAIGLAMSGSGNFSYAAPANNSAADVISTVTVTPTLLGCAGLPDNFNISIKPTPALDLPSDLVVCPSDSVKIPVFSAIPSAGTMYSWTNNNLLTGLAMAGNGQIVDFIAAQNNGLTAQVSNIVVTATRENCVSVSKSFNLTVNPMPTINTPSDLAVCPGETINATDWTSNLAGALFMWTFSNSNVYPTTSGMGQIADFSAIANNSLDTISGFFVAKSVENGCQSRLDTFFIHIKPTPFLAALPSQTVCPNQLVQVADYETNPAGSAFIWTHSNPAIGLAAMNGANQVPDFSTPATNNSGGNIVSLFQISPTLNGCAGDSQTFSITMTETPSTNFIPNQAVCTAEMIQQMFGGTAGASDFTWINDNTDSGIPASGTGDIQPFPAPENNTGAPITSTITVTSASVLSCTGAPISFTITVKPTPILGEMTDKVVCPAESINPDDFLTVPTGSTFAWIATNNVNIGLAAMDIGQISTYSAPANTSAILQMGVVTVTATKDLCVSASKNFEISIKPTPDIPALTDRTVCPGETISTDDFSTVPSGASFAWSNDNNLIGLSMGGVGQIQDFTAAANFTSINQTGLVTVDATLAGCTAVSETFNLTVKPQPKVSNPADIIVCGGSVVDISDFLSDVAGATFDWTNDNDSIGLVDTVGIGQISDFTTPILTGTMPMVANFTVHATATGCGSVTNTFKVTVLPRPVMLPISDITVCPGAPMNVDSFQISNGIAAFSWINSNPAVGFGTMGIGQIATQNAPLANATGADLMTKIQVIPSMGGCLGDTVSMNITVKETPKVENVADINVCPGEQILAELTGSGQVSQINWFNNNVLTGISASGTGNIGPYFAASNDSGVPVASLLQLVPKSALGCIGDTVKFSVMVKPTPFLVAVGDLAVCPGQAVTVAFQSLPAGADFFWANDNLEVGLPSNGSGNISYASPDMLNNEPISVPIVANLTIFPQLDGCAGSDAMFKITIKPTPKVSDQDDIEVCPGDSIYVESFSSNLAGATFFWENSNPAIGIPASGTTDIPPFAAPENNTLVDIIGDISIQATIDGCQSMVQNFSIIIHPRPQISAPTDVFACTDELIDPADWTSNLPNPVFYWENSNPAIGLISADTGQIQAYFAPANTDSVNLSGQIIAQVEISGCRSLPDTLQINIRPIPVMLPTSDKSVCSGDTIVRESFISNPIGANYFWINSDPETGLPATGSGRLDYLAKMNETGAPIIGQVIVTPILNGCAGANDTFLVKLNETAFLDSLPDYLLCGGDSLRIIFSTNDSAIVHWTNDNPLIGLDTAGNGRFIPDFTVNYPPVGQNYVANLTAQTTTKDGCISGIRNFKVTIRSTPLADTIPDQSACAGDDVMVNFTGVTAGATVSWYNSATNLGIPALGMGDFTIMNLPNPGDAPLKIPFFAVAEQAGCGSARDSFNITIQPRPVLKPTPDRVYCPNQNVFIPQFTTNTGTSDFTWTNSNIAIGIPASGIGQIPDFTTPPNTSLLEMMSRVIVEPSMDGCIGTKDTFNITLRREPVMDSIPNQCIAIGQLLTVPFTSNYAGTEFYWEKTDLDGISSIQGSGQGDFQQVFAGNSGATVRINVTPIGPDGCSGAARSFLISVNKPVPVCLPVRVVKH